MMEIMAALSPLARGIRRDVIAMGKPDLSLSRTSNSSFSGPCSSASDGSPCSTHADITDGSVDSTVLMGNVFYSPMHGSGSNAQFQPFVVAGLGMSHNTVDSWTRFNAGSGTPTRQFNSNSETEFAWSLGVGASWQLDGIGGTPMMLDVSWRYYDLGEAIGGSTSTPSGGVPVQPLTFDLTSQVFSIGLRIPLN
jgi:opacity protein-like surface antigen